MRRIVVSEKTTPAKPYHHGDLRAALLEAAELELAEKGIEGFTLRGCAKRAGVSHAAPAHHFGDAAGLLTALAAQGFERFIETQTRVKTAARPVDARANLLAAGIGYLTFAWENQALFRLMFSSERRDDANVHLAQRAQAAYMQLADDVAAVRGDENTPPQPNDVDVIAAWAMVHGLSDLMISGRIMLDGLSETERHAALESIIARVMPEPGATRTT
ncbi:TetR-like C-terminal domain-containing protein [Rhizobium sp. EC-SD404]|uniref:TetR/AcrR family transcriptional regulator n=1 Tax=Rhizobium sp. EC-SD404 TaxID=2038389 RepID=UPI0018FE7FD6|nr:TetR-like C-terminal domain-containing protein [Rhizobium sp. EC-SD404]